MDKPKKPWEHNPKPTVAQFSSQGEFFIWETLCDIRERVHQNCNDISWIKGASAVGAAVGSALLGLLLSGTLPR